jgi:voltage-gated potassium channel
MLPGHTPGQSPTQTRSPGWGRSHRGHQTTDELADVRRKFLISVFILFGVLVLGVLGFWLLGDDRSLFDALYITANVLTTVGDSRRTINRAEEVWETVLMLAGIVAALWAGGNLVAFLIGGEIRTLLGRRQLQTKISRLSGHFIVCGFGRMGRALCEALKGAGVEFVLVENDNERTAWADRLGYLYLNGDATSEGVLESARLSEARGLASCLRSDADNLLVVLTARGLSDSLTIIARAENTETESKLRRAGANRVICTPVLAASRVMTMMLHPAVDELMDLAVSGGDLEISKVKLSQLPAAAGKALRELELPAKTGLMVMAIVSPGGQRRLNPPPDAVLHEGDEMIVIGPAGGVGKMMELLGGE